MTSTSTYAIHLRVTGRQNIASSRLAYQPPHPRAPTPGIQTDVGRLVPTDESDALSLPEIGTNVSITSDLNEFTGQVIAVDDDILTIQVSRTRGSGAIILTDRTGFFSFRHLGAAFVAAE